MLCGMLQFPILLPDDTPIQAADCIAAVLFGSRKKKKSDTTEVSFLFILFRSREYECLFLSSIFTDHKQLK